MGNVTTDTVSRGSDIGISVTASYDELGRLYQQQGMHGQSQTYTYDGNSNVRSIINAAGHTTSYQYDALNRVTTTTEVGGSTPPPPNSAPTLTIPSSSTTGSYIVSWVAVSGANSYTLQEQIDGGGWTAMQTSGASSWSVNGRSNGSYGYRAQACNLAGCGPWSATATIAVALPPPPAVAPALNVPGSNSAGSYGVSWTAVTGASSYSLQEQINGGTWTTVQNSSAMNWSVSGKGNGSYGYRVQGCNVTGCGPWSATSVVTVLLPPSGTPSLSAPATNGNGSFTVNWTGVSGATTYNFLEQINGGSWTTALSGNATNWNTSGRSTGTYGYRVQACNASGCGPWSGTSTVTVSMPIAVNGQAYSTWYLIPSGMSGAADIGFNIVNGNTWQIRAVTRVQIHPVQASGAVPASAITVQFTYTYIGVPSGDNDAGGTVTNDAASPVAISSNPTSHYHTNTWPQTSSDRGRIYQVRIDFFNAIGANISSSTCTLKAETSGNL